jgi:streptogramin lyase
MFDHQKKSPFSFTRLLAMVLILSLSLSQTFGSTQSNNSSLEKKRATESKGRYSAEAGKEKPKEENIKPVAMAGKATLLGQNEKKGKFPWLIVGAATFVVGVIVVLLLTKKKEPKTNAPGPKKEQYEFVTKWGSPGTGDGEFQFLNWICVDSSGYVYVVDSGNFRIQKFTSSDSFITKWGSQGRADGQFGSSLGGIAVDSSGYVYVVDSGNYRIQKFTNNGSFVTKWGSYGTNDGQFNSPWGIAVDSSNYVYVSEVGANWIPGKIQKFTSDGSFVRKWESAGMSIAVDSSGYVYVANDSSNQIQKFTSDGSFVTEWGSYGRADGQFRGSYSPCGIAVDSSGYVFVTDPGNDRVQKFTSNGSFVTKWGTEGSADDQFENLHGIAVDSSGYVYVADTGNYRIQKFRLVSSNTMHDRQNSSLSLADKGILPNPVIPNGLKNGGSGRGNK